MQDAGYLVAAYLVIWLGLFAYLLWLAGAARGLRADLADLRATLDERERAAPAAPPAAPSAEPTRR